MMNKLNKVKKVKKGMAALLVATICLIPGISSAAAVQPYTLDWSYPCDWCGVGTVFEYFTTTPQVVDRQVNCTHYPYGVDIIYRWTSIRTLKCNYCGQGYSDPPVTRYSDPECHGFIL